MNGLWEQLLGLARLSLEDPRAGMRAVLRQDVPVPARTAGLLLMAVISALLMHLGSVFLPPPMDPMTQLLMASPIRTAIIQWLILAGSVLLIHHVGAAWGGRGSFVDALLVVVWLQVIMLGVQLVQLLALVLVPPVAGVLNLAGLALFFWLLTSFVAELHGFASRGKVFAGILVAAFGVVLLLAVMMSLLLGPEAFQRV
jgi:hypothetical protein